MLQTQEKMDQTCQIFQRNVCQGDQACPPEKKSFVKIGKFQVSYFTQFDRINIIYKQITSHRGVFSTFLECCQMATVFYHSVIHGLGVFICFMI